MSLVLVGLWVSGVHGCQSVSRGVAVAAFCRLGDFTHTTPAATEQQEIIVLVLDVSNDPSPLTSLQTLLHS